MARNIIEKIWEEHVVVSREGFPDVFAIDLQLIHEVTSPQAFDVLREREISLHASERTLATVDHNIPTSRSRIITDPASRDQVSTLRKNCEEFGVKLLDMESGKQGIVHVVGPENGVTQPGMTIVCGDSHTSTHGAFGAIAFGVGTTEVGQVMATGCLLRERPKTMKVLFEGKLQSGVTAKDMVLKLISAIGIGGATGHIIEYCGEVVKDLSMEERMTICNMSIECGARAGLFGPDEVLIEYLRGRSGVRNFDRAVDYWLSFVSDQGCSYDREVVIDLAGLAPMVTWGTNPGQGCGIDESVPEVDEAGEKALEYTGLSVGQPLEGVKVDFVFIGSCTNARISDLRAAAEVFRGRKVAEGVEVYLVPGSEMVLAEACAEGLDEVFAAAGVEMRSPGCSMCLAMNDDKVPAGKRCASTSNRNFIGRQGTGSITHLMSPAMAAAAAVTGFITDVRKFFKK